MGRGISDDKYLERSKRMEKIGKLLEEGVPQRDIAKQMGVEYRTVENDMKVMAVLKQGSISPEITAEKRVLIDDKFVETSDELERVYHVLIKEGKYSQALSYMKASMDANKFRATLWGLDQDLTNEANFNADSINFNKVDVTLSSNEFKDIKRIISRQNENLIQDEY